MKTSVLGVLFMGTFWKKVSFFSRYRIYIYLEFLFSYRLEIKPRTLYMIGKHSDIELYLQS
jgi:hypothetical protein